MQLKKQKKKQQLQTVFQSNINKIWRGRYKSKKQKSALDKIKLLFESRQAVIKLFNDYSSIVSDTVIRCMSESEACSPVAKGCNSNVSDYSNLQI